MPDTEDSTDGAPELGQLLARHENLILGLVRRHAGSLLRLDGAEDLAQGARLKALGQAGSFEYRGEEELRAWLTRVVRAYLADRHDYWVAARRNGGTLLRLTNVGSPSGLRGAADPADGRTGPVTFADRSEQLALAAQAASVLLPRDQQLVGWLHEEVPLREVAERLGVSYDAAERARLRAVDRFRRAYELLARG